MQLDVLVRWCAVRLAACWALVLVAAQPGAASPLDAQACGPLKEEQVRLEAAGARARMERGPEWARANLPAEGLKEIARLIEVDEQIAFRCPRPKPAAVEKNAGEAGKGERRTAAPSGEPARAEPGPAPQHKPRANAAAKAAPQGKTGAASSTPGAEVKTGAPQKAKAVPKAKPKADDAYSPPPKPPVSPPAPPAK